MKSRIVQTETISKYCVKDPLSTASTVDQTFSACYRCGTLAPRRRWRCAVCAPPAAGPSPARPSRTRSSTSSPSSASSASPPLTSTRYISHIYLLTLAYLWNYTECNDTWNNNYSLGKLGGAVGRSGRKVCCGRLEELALCYIMILNSYTKASNVLPSILVKPTPLCICSTCCTYV